MKKRFKSFLITASSLAGTAFLSVVLTPEWATFLHFAKNTAIGWGVPAIIVTLVGVFVSEIWKQILNNQTISKAKGGFAGGSFEDYENKLY